MVGEELVEGHGPSDIETGEKVTSDGLKVWKVVDTDYSWGINKEGVLLESTEERDKGKQIKKTDLQMNVHWSSLK